MFTLVKKNWPVVLLIVVAFICYMITIVPSGNRYCFDGLCGLYFWGAHGHDAIWHLAMVATSFDTVPFVLPNFAGANLGGYNYFLDIIIFIFAKIGINPLISYFKIIPILWFGVFTLLLLKLSDRIHKGSLFGFIFLFFAYFSGSFSYLITLFKDGTMWGSGAILAMQPLLSLTNVQFALSIAVLTLILIVVKDVKNAHKNSLLLSMLVALNLALKFYAGVISLFIVGLFFVYQLIRDRSIKQFVKSILLISALTAIVLLVFYKPDSQSVAGAPIIYSPLSTVYPLVEDPNILYMKDLTNARYFLESIGKFSPRLIVINAYIVGLYLILNFGTRIIGALYIAHQVWKKKISYYEIIVTSTIIFSMLLSMLFVQKGIWWNTVQFSYYAFFLSNIFVAQAVYAMVKKYKKVGIIFATVVFLLTIPNSIDIVRGFYQRPGHTYLPDGEMKALQFLKKQPSGIVYFPPPKKDNSVKTNSKQKPLHVLGDNAYVTAFSGKQSYIADEVQLELINVNYKERLTSAGDWSCATLRHVDYLYEIVSSPIGTRLDNCRDKYKQIYKNDSATLYKVSR